MVSLIASGLSSSAVGTMAGQVIMQGFVGFRIPLWVRRLVTMAPSFAVVAWGVNPTQALIFSQIALSIALPVPMVALVLLMRRPAVMGKYVTSRHVGIAAITATTLGIAVQWEMSEQRPGRSSRSRVTPPSTHSRRRLCP
jgi:manganese transport protein